jgi:archaellum component FlaC
MQATLARLENEQVKGNEKRIADIREALKKVEAEDEHLEKEVELLKRKALRESEQIKWDALREVWMSTLRKY